MSSCALGVCCVVVSCVSVREKPSAVSGFEQAAKLVGQRGGKRRCRSCGRASGSLVLSRAGLGGQLAPPKPRRGAVEKGGGTIRRTVVWQGPATTGRTAHQCVVVFMSTLVQTARPPAHMQAILPPSGTSRAAGAGLAAPIPSGPVVRPSRNDSADSEPPDEVGRATRNSASQPGCAADDFVQRCGGSKAGETLELVHRGPAAAHVLESGRVGGIVGHPLDGRA
jgi:hypothetical protein